MRQNAGFTVFELLIVIAIAGVLTAIAVPNFLGYQYSYRLKGAISTLRGDLYGTKMLAIKRGVQYKVVFTADGYQIQRGTSSSGTFTLDQTEITRNFADEYPGVTADTAATANPVFSPRGTATPVTITLKTSQKSQTITISLAGRIKVN
uniref:Type II secretion system protein H n=1 Tax=Candidatus Desulfatibia profunda TaxID=2841695 RepID=A0A8J6THX0_9BACT|nr:GspH/FimT family pseudopilin [Candidatus Desulfatibia profunda]